jgi:2-polyprenyl-3-methyl-5-hydroxy-6-metoxy-1,4-benzoquinol methylase
MRKLESLATDQDLRHCHLCGNQDFDKLYPLGGMAVLQCKACGLVFSDLSPAWGTLEAMYDASYYQERHKYYFENIVMDPSITREDTNIGDFRKALDLITEYKQAGKLLDVGCALGIFLSMACRRGWDAYGIDISEYAASYARNVMGLKVAAGTLEEVGYPEKSFDVITLLDVLEHFAEPSRQLKEVRRILKDDGIVLLNTPNQDGLLRIMAHGLYRFSGGIVAYPLRKLYHCFHLYYYTPRTLHALLEKNGFRIEQLRKNSIPSVKARGRTVERVIVKALSFPERICGREYELIAIARKNRGHSGRRNAEWSMSRWE